VPDIGAEPTLNDYYEPSALQKEYELMFMTGGLALAGWAALSPRFLHAVYKDGYAR